LKYTVEPFNRYIFLKPIDLPKDESPLGGAFSEEKQVEQFKLYLYVAKEKTVLVHENMVMRYKYAETMLYFAPESALIAAFVTKDKPVSPPIRVHSDGESKSK
jgi:hypothetical protein